MHLCVCLSVPCHILTLLHGPGCNLGEWQGVPSSCAQLGRFAIGAWVSLLWQHSLNAKCQRVFVFALCVVQLLLAVVHQSRWSCCAMNLRSWVTVEITLKSKLGDTVLLQVRQQGPLAEGSEVACLLVWRSSAAWSEAVRNVAKLFSHVHLQVSRSAAKAFNCENAFLQGGLDVVFEMFVLPSFDLLAYELSTMYFMWKMIRWHPNYMSKPFRLPL